MNKHAINVSSCRSIARVYQAAAEVYADRPAFATASGPKREFQPISFAELYSQGLNLATGLIEMGLEQNSRVGLFSDNRLEWILANYGIQLAGAADVPRGSDVTEHDVRYILSHAGVEILFVENQVVLELVQKNRTHLPALKHIILMAPQALPTGSVLHIRDICEQGRLLRQRGDRRAEKRIAQTQGEDLMTLIYTSGTTGKPRGVMLTHANLLSQLRNLPVRLSVRDRILSILPVWHIFERTFEISAIYCGACTYYTDVRNLRQDMARVRPTFLASAPRLWEMIYQGIQSRMQKAGSLSRALFRAAVFSAARVKGSVRFLSFQNVDLEGRSPLESGVRAVMALFAWCLFLLPYGLLNLLVLRRLRSATGGALRFSCSGGGALPMHVDEFFNNIGIPVLEGYGLTETAPIVAARRPGKIVIGTVGEVIDETELRLVDLSSGETVYDSREPGRGRGLKGEIHVRGPQVMKGYYADPEATRRVLNAEGWLNTGDLGLVTYNNCLKIVGRSKETIVLLGGENVEPVPVENRLLESPLIDQVMLVGQDRKYLSALIVINPAAFDGDGQGRNYAELAADEKVRQQIQAELRRLVNGASGFKTFERVVSFAILPRPFEAGDELTAKLSLRRHVIAEKYRDLIESL